MARASLTDSIRRLDTLLSKWGTEAKPTPKNIRSFLFRLRKSLQAIQDSQPSPKLEATITKLNGKIADFEAKIADRDQLLATASAKIDRLETENKEREKKERGADLPDQQWELLRILEPEDVNLTLFPDILQSVSFPADEVAWHLGQLRGLQPPLADFTLNASDAHMWFRTHEGNKRVIARRRANISERLPEIFEKVLLTIYEADGGKGINTAGIAFVHDITEDLALSYGERLREPGFVTQHLTGVGIVFKAHPDGIEYIKTHHLIEKQQDERKRIEEERRLPVPDELSEPRRRKFPDLPELEERILEILKGKDDGVSEDIIHIRLEGSMQLEGAGKQITLAKVKHILRTQLKPKRFATYDSMEATYGTGHTWFITESGNEYFSERGRL